MKCPNCDYEPYSIGSPCECCTHYEKPEYWDLGFAAVYTEPKNWAVLYNGVPIEQEIASERDAWDKVFEYDREMSEYNDYVTGQLVNVLA